MDRKVLEFLRCVVPGGIVLVYMYAAARAYGIAEGLSDEQWFILKRESVLFILAAVIGYLYHQTRVRDVDYLPRLNRVRENIRRRLVEMTEDDPYVKARRDELIGDQRLMEIFYNLIDNDNSLTERALGVRMSGLAMTSAADVFVLSAAFAIVYSILGIADRFRGLPDRFVRLGESRISVFAILAGIAVVFAVIGKAIAPVLERRHIEGSNEQLRYIETMLKDRVLELLKNL